MSDYSRFETGEYPIFTGLVTEVLDEFIQKNYSDYKAYILVDSNTLEKCLPVLDFADVLSLRDAEVLEVEPGEESKSVEVANQLWESLLSLSATRKSLLVNLGGGMITDLGGFVASTFKRGIPFINLPTSLLAMVDASVGGKTGVNLAGSKNQVGVFAHPAAVFMHTPFLKTLPKREKQAGKAEMYKHGLIADANHWNELAEADAVSSALIERSVQIKNAIVTRDFKEAGERKKLNFGHTVGHAIESRSLHTDAPLLHGEAVAAGMQCEVFLSMKHSGLSEQEGAEILNELDNAFGKVEINPSDFESLIAFMRSDKKNTTNTFNFALLNAIGAAQIDVELPEEEVRKALTEFVNR